MKNNFVTRYFSGIWSELKKVTWPTRQEVVNHTIIVVVSASIAIAITSLVDMGLAKAVEYLAQNQ